MAARKDYEELVVNTKTYESLCENGDRTLEFRSPVPVFAQALT